MSLLQTAEHAVLRDPWPDAPRLAFADAVAATDPERSRSIRAEIDVLQKRRGGVTHRLPEEDWLPLGQTRVAVTLTPAFADLFPKGEASRRFAIGRGFIERVWAPAAWLLDHAPVLFSRAPVLDLNVTGLAGHVDAFFDAPWLARIRYLDVTKNALDDAAAARIAASPFLGRLRGLELSFNKVGAAGLDALATTPNLPQLRYLGFRQNRAPDPNHLVEHYETYDTGPLATAETAAFLARHPGCRWIGRFGSNQPFKLGLLQAADGGPIA